MTEMQFHLRASTAQGAECCNRRDLPQRWIDHVARQTMAIA
jgi:hypothetical protein